MILAPVFSYLFPPLRLSLGLAGDLGWGVARPKNSNDLNKHDLDLVGCQTFKFKFK